jgi:hypothetical protein
LAEHVSKDPDNHVEVLLLANERGGQLDDGLAAVIGAAHEAGVEQRRREEPSQEPFAFLAVEGLTRRFVLHELDPVKVASAPDLADDGQVF